MQDVNVMMDGPIFFQFCSMTRPFRPQVCFQAETVSNTITSVSGRQVHQLLISRADDEAHYIIIIIYCLISPTILIQNLTLLTGRERNPSKKMYI